VPSGQLHVVTLKIGKNSDEPGVLIILNIVFVLSSNLVVTYILSICSRISFVS